MLTLVAAVALLVMPLPAAQAKAPAGRHDRAFLADVIGHHAMAIDMAEMARENATHDEFERAAEQIIWTRTAEVKQMRAPRSRSASLP